MVNWIIPPDGLIEPTIAPEFYVDGAGAIEIVGSCVRQYFVIEQLPLETRGAQAQKVVVVKLVRPIARLPEAIERMAHCLMPPGTRPPNGAFPRLVR